MMIFNLCKKYLFKYKGYLVVYVVLTMFLSIISLVSPYITGDFIDHLIEGNGMGFIYRFCFILVSLTIIRLLVGYITSIMYMRIQVRMGFEMNRDVLFHIQNLPLSFTYERNIPQLNQMVNNDANAVTIFCITFLQDVITNVLTLCATIYISFQMNILISLLFIIFCIAYFLLYVFARNILYKATFLFQENQTRFFARLQEQLQLIPFLQKNSFQYTVRNRLNASYTDLYSSAQKYQKASYLFSSADNMIYMGSQVLLYFYGGIMVLKGQFTIGMFTIFSAYFNMMLSSARYFINLGKTYQENLVSCKRLIGLIEIEEERCGSQVFRSIESIKTKGIGFSYKEKEIFRDVELEFHKGKIYGIIGTNGSGKSTFLNLIAGLNIGEKSGDIFVNEVNLNDADLYDLRKRHIGISEQEPMLIDDTIRYNLFLDRYDPHLERFWEFSNLLHFSEYITRCEEGLDTIMNDSQNISGGEKQKISILRLLLKNPDVMIFDEPTSALDEQSASHFLTYLQKIKKEKIIIIVAHSRDVIGTCDILYKFQCKSVIRESINKC